MKNKRLHYTLFSTSFFIYNQCYSSIRLLLYLTQTWISRRVPKVSLAVASGILFELMVLPDFAHTINHVKLASSNDKCIYIRANEVQKIDTVSSLKDGQWTDPAVWSVGRVPTINDVVFLLHTVTIPSGVLAKVQGLLYNANGHLSFEDFTSKLQFYPPVQLRLKTVQSGTAVTTYIYDSQNRLSTIGRSDNSLNILSYDDAGKKYINFNEYPNAADQTTGFVTQYPYTLDSTSFKAYRQSITSSINYGITVATYSYEFDANKHLIRYYTTDGRDDATSQRGIAFITYAGEDVVRSTSYGGRTSAPPRLNQYDDKINPFFGLLDPTIDPIQRFSRNNVVKSVLSDMTGYPPNASVTYDYEYNQQNLPIKRTTKQVSNGAVINITTYSYESY